MLVIGSRSGSLVGKLESEVIKVKEMEKSGIRYVMFLFFLCSICALLWVGDGGG